MFYLRDFKNFATAELNLNQPVTLLIGPNGAGKSNIIESVELLAFLADGGALHEITDIGRGGKLEIRGGLDACARRGTEEFTLGIEVKTEDTLMSDLEPFVYEITVKVGAEPAVIAERLQKTSHKTPVFEIRREDSTDLGGNTVRYDNYAQGGNKPMETISATRSALSQYARFAKKNAKLSETLELVDSVISCLTAPAVFDPIPKEMRDHQRVSERQLARNGFNLSPALNALYTLKMTSKAGKKLQAVRKEKDGTAGRILNRIKQLPDEPFVGFDFDRTNSGDVMFGFSLPEGGKPVYARVLSDGTLRALAIFTALETSKAGRRLIIEEFDNGVHPSRVPILTEAIFDCATRNSLRVIATTHNPATLNALTAEQLNSVLLAVHDPDSGNAKLLPLRDLPGYIDFIEQGRLGDLVTRRVYEQHLVPDYEKHRTERMNAWLNALP